MRASSHITKSPDRGFTIIEVLVAVLISGVILAGFTGFYLASQRANRHQQIEIESSQALRTALEQMSRDLRAAGVNMTSATFANFPFVSADTTQVEFELDADSDGAVSNTISEHKGFRLTGTTLESYDGTTWNAFADNISSLQFTYRDCTGTTIPTPVSTAGGTNIASIDISLTVTRPIVGGLPVSRTETDSIRLRNKRCT